MGMLSVLVVVVSLISAKAFTQQEWANTAHAFEDQAMISQKITKEFLLSVTTPEIVSAGNGTARLLAEGSGSPTMNASGSAPQTALTSLELYDKHINQLTHGDPAHGILGQADMGALVQNAMTTLSGIWVPFKALIQSNTNGVVANSVLVHIASESNRLLAASQIVMEAVVIMEQANGAIAATTIVTIARRQTMLMQKMLKELLFVGLGVDVAHMLHDLHETELVIDGANKGIILGAPWAGVPILTKFCTLNEMTQVSTKWGITKPFVDEVIGAGVLNGRAVANQNAQAAVLAGDDLEHEMEVAVSLFMHDDGSCDILKDISTAEWKYVLNSVDIQRYYGQMLALQVLQVANNVSIQASKVELTINMAAAYAALRTLIEGSEKHSAPPTQEIADQLILAYKAWQEISREFDTVIFQTVVDPIMVGKVIRLSAVMLREMGDVMQLYLTQVEIADTKKEVPAYMITTAGRQRMYLQKIGLEAAEIKFYMDHDMQTEMLATLDHLNNTRDNFLTTHWNLLQGDAANNVSEMTDLCIIKKMKQVKDTFDLLKTAAWRVAFGEKDQITEMIRVLPIAHGFMDTAVDYYSNGVETCPEVEPSIEEWQAGILAAGGARASSQKTCTDYLWGAQSVPGPNPGMVLATFWGADGTIGEGMVNAVNKLRFGWGGDNIPAPYNNKLRDEIARVSKIVTNFSRDLLLTSSSDVVYDSNAMLVECEILVASYLTQASAAFPILPVHRIELSTRLEFLANRMLKEALLIRGHGVRRLRSTNHNHTIAIDSYAVTRTMNEYARVVTMLEKGNPSLNVPEVIRQRADIQYQQQRVASAYAALQTNVYCVANPRCVDTLTTKQSLNDLEKEIALVTLLYYELDPAVPEVYPWTVVIYIVVGVLLSGVAGFGCYRGLRMEKSS